MKINHNHSIDFYRCIFTLIIIVHHAAFSPQLQHGYLAVEFFFMTSGYFLIQKLESNNNSISALTYTKNKLLKLYPHYLFSFIILFFVFSISKPGFFNIDNILKSIPELLLIQNIGIFPGGINYPLWYLSVLIVAGYFTYYLLSNYSKFFTHFIIPFILLFVYVYLVNNGQALENWDTIGIFYLPFWRGFASICIGIIIYKASKSNKVNLANYNILLNIIEISSFSLFMYLLFSNENNDIYAIIFLPIIIFNCFYNKSIVNKLFNHNIWSRLSKYTYAIYLNHGLFIIIYKSLKSKLHFENLSIIYVVIFLVILLIYSILTETFINKVTYRLSKRSSKNV